MRCPARRSVDGRDKPPNGPQREQRPSLLIKTPAVLDPQADEVGALKEHEATLVGARVELRRSW
jgi:hypothetical protein